MTQSDKKNPKVWLIILRIVNTIFIVLKEVVKNILSKEKMCLKLFFHMPDRLSLIFLIKLSSHYSWHLALQIKDIIHKIKCLFCLLRDSCEKELLLKCYWVRWCSRRKTLKPLRQQVILTPGDRADTCLHWQIPVCLSQALQDWALCSLFWKHHLCEGTRPLTPVPVKSRWHLHKIEPQSCSQAQG